MQPGDVEFLTPDEVARALRISKRAVFRAIEKGEIPCVKIRRKCRIPKAFLVELIQKAQEAAREKAESAPKA